MMSEPPGRVIRCISETHHSTAATRILSDCGALEPVQVRTVRINQGSSWPRPPEAPAHEAEALILHDTPGRRPCITPEVHSEALASARLRIIESAGSPALHQRFGVADRCSAPGATRGLEEISALRRPATGPS